VNTPLFWYFYRQSPAVALREGDWMLIGYLEAPKYEFSHPLIATDLPYIHSSQIMRFELYNLREDISQEHDVYEKNTERAERMKTKMKVLHREVLSEKPAWSF
jgi:arylsulfatase A